MLRDETLLFSGIAVGLTVAGITANRPNKGKPIRLPNLHQGRDKFVHHLIRVMRSGSDPQTFFTAGDGGIVNGLYIDVVFPHQIIGNLSAFLWIANLK